MYSNLLTRVSFSAIAVCALMFAGCASWQVPRIDPTGEGLLAWPNQPPPAVVAPPGFVPPPAPPGAAVITPPPGLPVAAPAVVPAPAVAAPLPFGNVQAPPVYSDPTPPPIVPAPAVIPQVPYGPGIPTAPGVPAPSLPAGTVTPAVPIVAPVPGAPPVAMVPPGHEFVRLTPDRLVAPVGSEILLKAGVVSEDGNLHPGERIEWAVARNGVGQFTDMGLRNAGQLYASLEAPQKIDDWSAVGRTAFLPVSFGDGLFISDADVQIKRGESWVTLTSCAEGTSQVTAFAPALCEFNQATTSIYWIDAQWTLPASVVAECGRPHILTTTVFRRTNGTPLAGWVVRYTVGSGGSLGYEGGNTVDARTDAMGRASVEVSPSQASGGVTNVGIAIVRPQTVGQNAMPQVELARGAATITWSANAGAAGAVAPAAPLAPALPAPPVGPAPFSPPPASPVQTPAPYLPPTPPPQPTTPPAQPAPATSNPTQPSPYTPPPAGRARLELTLKLTTAEQVAVGQNVGYELTITNRGDGVARHIELVDRFDAGLSHIGDTLKEHVVKKLNIRELAPNDSEKIPLDFQVVAGGRQCHEATVTADGADLERQQACCTGIQAALEVKVTGILRRVVGEVAEFNVAVRNTGSSGAAGVVLRVQFDPSIEPVIDTGVERLPDGSIVVRLDRELAANEKRVFRLQGRCVAPSAHACARATVTAAGGASSQDEACVEILPAIPASAPGTGPP